MLSPLLRQDTQARRSGRSYSQRQRSACPDQEKDRTENIELIGDEVFDDGSDEIDGHSDAAAVPTTCTQNLATIPMRPQL
jgi:hypothetical protein